MDRKLNYFSAFLLVVVFITSANPTQQLNILLGFALSVGFSFAAFLLQRLSLDGMFAAIVMGTFIFGLGGWPIASLVLIFFISSALITKQRDHTEGRQGNGARRNGFQVWANGFWLVICLVLYVVFDFEAFATGGVAVIAVATADTWATELGSKKPESTYLITNFQTVVPGTDGGISIKGTLAGLIGSAVIAGAALYVFSLHFYIFLSIFIAGFSGCLLDSYFGAIFQRNNSSVSLPVIDKTISIDNNLVNGISTGLGALLTIILKLLIV